MRSCRWPRRWTVDAVHLGDCQPGQQRRRCGQGVERGEVLSVGDEPLEDAAGQVMGVVDAGRVDRLGGVPQPAQDDGRVARWELLEDVLGDGEDGPSN